MNSIAHDLVKFLVSEKKYDVITEYAQTNFPNKKSPIVVTEYAGSDIRVCKHSGDIHVLCPSTMTPVQESALTEALEKGTIFDDADTVDRSAKYIELTTLPHRGICNAGKQSPEKLHLVISLVIGRMDDTGHCEVNDTDIKNGCNLVRDVIHHKDTNNSVNQIVDDYLDNKDDLSIIKPLRADIGKLQDEIDNISDVSVEDTITDEDWEYLDMENYADEDKQYQEGFFSTIKDWFNKKRQEGMDKLQPPKKEPSVPQPPDCPEYDITKTVLEKIKQDTLVDCVNIDTTIVPCDSVRPTDSIIGGKPLYAEKIPSIKGKPLRFLAQINCSELPELKGFPNKGLLQFWIDRDFCYPDNNCEVIYYEDPTNNVIDQLNIDEKMYDKEDRDWPIICDSGSVGKMTFKKSQESMSVSDYRFDDLFVNVYNEIAEQTEGVEKISAFYKIRKDVWDYMWRHTNLLSGGYGCKIGGYPHFCQWDPRESGETEELLLLQLDSDGDFIHWGDNGTANFFITEKDLNSKNFGKAFFYWDCY